MTLRITSKDWLLTIQMKDEKLKSIKEVLSSVEETPDEKQIHNDYKIKSERIYRKMDGKLKWVVPSAVKWRVVGGSHYGEEKTL